MGSCSAKAPLTCKLVVTLAADFAQRLVNHIASSGEHVSLQALQLRCEQFMRENFHKILDDPLLQVSIIQVGIHPAQQTLLVHAWQAI